MRLKESLLFILIYVITGCSGKKSEVPPTAQKPENVVVFSDEQLQISGVKWNKLQKSDISDIIECNGTIEVPPQNILTVSPAMGGNIKSINLLPGSRVKKGDILAVLEHQDYLKLQQEFIEAASRYNYQKEEYKRQGELTLEQATSLKKMQFTESEYKSLEAKVFALSKQLEMLGIEAQSLKPENINSEITLRSPLDGYVTRVFYNRGKFIGTGENLCEIIDRSHLHLSLNVYEKDLSYIKTGQKIEFFMSAIPDKPFTATIELIGQSVNEDDHSVPVHAHVTSVSDNLKPGMFISAKIMSNPRYVFTLPVTSLIKKDSGFYVYTYNNKKFTRTMVNVGKELDTNVEIIPSDSDFLNKMFVTEGAYYLESEWEKEL